MARAPSNRRKPHTRQHQCDGQLRQDQLVLCDHYSVARTRLRNSVSPPALSAQMQDAAPHRSTWSPRVVRTILWWRFSSVINESCNGNTFFNYFNGTVRPVLGSQPDFICLEVIPKSRTRYRFICKLWICSASFATLTSVVRIRRSAKT